MKKLILFFFIFTATLFAQEYNFPFSGTVRFGTSSLGFKIQTYNSSTLRIRNWGNSDSMNVYLKDLQARIITTSGNINGNSILSQTTLTAYGVITGASTLQINGGAVLNYNGASSDVQVKGLNDNNLLFTDGSADSVGIGINTPLAKLHVLSHSVNTVAILRFGNVAGHFQIFRADATPEGSITGSIGDLVNETTGGRLYYKRTGSGTNTGWQYFLDDADIGVLVQGYDVELASLAGLTSAADKLPYFTGSGTASLADFTSFGRSIVDDANEATFKATVNLEIGTDVQAYDADLTTYAGITPSANVQSVLGAADYSAIRSLLDVWAIADSNTAGKPITYTYFTMDNIGGKVYGTSGFSDSSYTLDLTQNIYLPVTNTNNDLYTDGVSTSGLTWTGDSVQVSAAGDYEITWDLSWNGSNTDNYHIAIFVNNVEQNGKAEAQRGMSGTDPGVGTGNTILTLTANAWISLRIKNTANNNDPTFQAGNIVIKKL